MNTKQSPLKTATYCGPKDLISRLVSLTGRVEHDECHAFFVYQFKILEKDTSDIAYLDYVMKLLRDAGQKGFHITTLPVKYRQFSAQNGYIF